MCLSNRAIARELGVTHTAVNKAVTAGRIDPAKSLEEIRRDWERNADSQQRARRLGSDHESSRPVSAPHPSARRVTAAAAVHAPEFDTQESGPTRLNGLSKFDVELREMIVRLRLRQLELQERERSLVAAKDVRAAWAALVLNAKSRLLAIADELSEALALETDPVVCKEIVDAKLYEVLNELARYQLA
jgi:hypothetical protein